jgi:DHA2 family multidrug resistance protein
VTPRAYAIPAGVSERTYRNRWILAATVTFASMMELIDTSIVNVAIPHMMGNLGATLDQIAWVSTGYIVANVIVLPITGWLSSLLGRRRYFAGSIALFTVASFFCGNAHTLPELVAWRIVQGLGGGALLSTAQAVLYEVFPREEYAAAMAIFGVGIMVGPTLGPTLGGWITDVFSWPWIFYINIPFGMMALLLTLTYMPDSVHRRAVGRIDYAGLILLVLGIGALQTMLERGERLGWFESGEVVAYAVVSGVSLVALVAHELTTEHPIIDLRILRNRQFAAGVAFAGALGLCLYATVFVLPVYLQSVLGFTAMQTGMVILPGALASAATMAVMGRTGGKYDPRVVITAGVGLFLIAMWRHHRFTTQSGAGDFVLPLILRGVGLGMIFVPLSNLAVARLRMDQIPSAVGLYNLTRQLGGSVGIALSATTLQHLQVEHRALLIEHVNAFNPVATQRLAGLAAVLRAQGVAPAVADLRALAVLNGQVARQALMLSFEDLFLLFGFSLALALPLLLVMKPPKSGMGPGGAH